MPTNYFEAVGQAPPQVQLNTLIWSHMLTQSIGVVAELGIADLLAQGPRSVAEIADATGAHAQTLSRVLRLLISAGVFAQVEPGRLELGPLGEHLRSDHPTSLRDLARLSASDALWRAWGELGQTVRTGETGFEHAHDVPIWEYRATHPAAAAVFDAAMTSLSAAVGRAVAAAYDVSGAGTIVDVAGGQGALLATLLQASPSARGILLDLPHVIERARRTVDEAGVVDRCELVAGDMFADVPRGGDIYLLSYILHDWDDERSIAILKQCRAAMDAGSRLLIVEGILPTGDGPSLMKLSDLQMLIGPGGQERTESEYQALCVAAGLTIARVVPTQSLRSIIEAVPA